MCDRIIKWFADRKAAKAVLKYADKLPYTALITNHAEHRMFSVIIGIHVFLIPHKDQHIVYYFGEALSPSTRIFNAISKKVEPEAQLQKYDNCNPQSWITHIIKQAEKRKSAYETN